MKNIIKILLLCCFLQGCSFQESINNSPEWQEVKINDSMTISIPASSPPLETHQLEDGDFMISFGESVNENGNYITREYRLHTYKSKPTGVSLDEIKENQCGEEVDENRKVLKHLTPPTKVTVGNITGTSYLVGGFGACSTYFSFKIGENYFFLGKTYPYGSYDPEHIITPDMEKIIQGITIK